MVFPSFLAGRPAARGPQPFRERAATDVEHGGRQNERTAATGRAASRSQSSSGMLDDRRRRSARGTPGEQPHQDPKKRLHERPRASPSRFSATAAVCFSRCVSSRQRAPAAGGQRVIPARSPGCASSCSASLSATSPAPTSRAITRYSEPARGRSAPPTRRRRARRSHSRAGSAASASSTWYSSRLMANTHTEYIRVELPDDAAGDSEARRRHLQRRRVLLRRSESHLRQSRGSWTRWKRPLSASRTSSVIHRVEASIVVRKWKPPQTRAFAVSSLMSASEASLRVGTTG